MGTAIHSADVDKANLANSLIRCGIRPRGTNIRWLGLCQLCACGCFSRIQRIGRTLVCAHVFQLALDLLRTN